ncbi:mechanosensitive ion channel family protein [Nocardioides terrisoli]|uniref:mechanosensitive ion channel family protein n=1 Tax=Nocardioides terrisoli TaxID=3388267 RepID=UPI00287BA824|nr:mechanosensitive ion channel family protein [Nocardioides marmorisolisilvae]
MHVVQSLLDIPRTCQNPDSVTCAAVYRWTHDATLAHAASWVLGRPASIVLIILVAFAIRWVVHRIIDRTVDRAEKGMLPGRLSGAQGGGRRGSQRRAQRAKSLGSLLHSISTGLIYGIATVMILAQLGVNIAPIIASAGVVGIAIGFGAQTLVKDFLSGIAMMVEDQYGVGDVVNLGTVSGTVEAIGLRVTRLRDVAGTVWYVRNGEILSVGNMSQNWARAVLDVRVGYDEDVASAERVLGEVAHTMWDDDEYRGVVIEEPEVWGVEDMTSEGVVIRVVLKTAPMQQWAVAREMRKRILNRFRHEDMSLPMSMLIRNDAPGEDLTEETEQA